MIALSRAFEELYAKVAKDSNLEAVKGILNNAPHDQQAALLKQQNSDMFVWRLSCPTSHANGLWIGSHTFTSSRLQWQHTHCQLPH